MKGMRRCADERGAGDRRRRCRAPTGAGPDFRSGSVSLPSLSTPRRQVVSPLSRHKKGGECEKAGPREPAAGQLEGGSRGPSRVSGRHGPSGRRSAQRTGRASTDPKRGGPAPRTRGGPRAGAPPSLTAMRRLGCGGGGKEGVRGAGCGWEGWLKYMQLPRGCPAARRARIGPGPELRRGPSPAQAQSQARAAEASSLAHAERAGAKKWREAEERGAEADRTEAESKRSGSKEERRRRGAEAERSGGEAERKRERRPPIAPATGRP